MLLAECDAPCRKKRFRETRAGGALCLPDHSRGAAPPDQLPTTIMSTLKAAILIVSTTASKDPSADSSVRILKDVFEREGGGKWEVVKTKIVGDEVLDIQRIIMNWADQQDAVNLIISTGGTGFAVHDSTPEVSIFSRHL